MTGTAVTEAEEFDAVYELTTISVPTHRPVIRVDKNDKVYIDQNAKWHALTEHISFAHSIGQPLLI